MDGSHSLLIRTAVWHSDAARGPSTPSFDHLVGAEQEPLRDVQSKSLGGGQSDDEIEPGRLLDGQISGLCPAQNLVHVFGGPPELVREVRAIGYEASSFDALPKAMHRRQSCTQRESVDANSAGDYERVGYDINCVCAILERLEGRRDIGRCSDFQHCNRQIERAGRCLNLTHFQHAGGITYVGLDRQPAETRDNLAQEFEALTNKIC